MKNKTTLIILAISGGILCLCCSGIGLVAIFGDKAGQQLEPANVACSGQGVPAAAAYAGGPGVHKVAVFVPPAFGGDGYHYSLLSIRPQWRPETLAETELVLCLEEREQQVVERCEYESGFLDGANVIERHQYRQAARLVAAQTGTEVATTTLVGSVPDACPEEAEFDRGDDTQHVRGSTPGQDEIEAFIEAYVLGTAAPPSAAGQPAAAPAEGGGDVTMCDTRDGGLCTEYRLSERFTAPMLEAAQQACGLAQGTWSSGSCPRENLVGTCDLGAGGSTQLYYSPQIDAQAAQSMCPTAHGATYRPAD